MKRITNFNQISITSSQKYQKIIVIIEIHGMQLLQKYIRCFIIEILLNWI